MKKRMLAMLLTLVMIVSVLPLAAFAAEDECSGWGSNGAHNWRNGQCQNWGCYERCAHEDYNAGKCTRCGMVCSHQKSNGFWGSQSAFVNGVCSVCDYECPHNSYSQNKCTTCGMAKPNCTHPEYKDGQCTKCGAICRHNNTEAIPNQTPNCGETGTTGGTRCTVCKMVRTQPTVVPATGEHNYEFVETLVEPNCSGPGKDLYECDVCGATEERDTTPGGHVWEFVRYQKDNAPTCSKTGVGVFDCKYCDEVSAQTVPALGHDKIVLGDVVAVSCEKEGIRAYKCGREGCTNMWLDYVAATGHSEVPIDAVPATCTATGLTEGKVCTVCKEITLAQSVAPMIPHTFNVDVAELKATCTKDGYTAHKKCQFCEATEGKEVLHLLGHNFVNFICTRCNVRDGSCEHVNGVISIKDATCTEDGKESFTCPDCGYSYEKTLSHPGHSAVEGICTTCGTVVCNHPSHKKTVNTTPSTCSEYGTRTETCTCGWSRTVRLPLADHDYVNGVCKNCKCIGSKNNTIDFNDVFIVG